MNTRVLIPIASGFEEIEALTVVDILRRAGAEVTLAGVESASRVVGRSDVTVVPDTGLEEALTDAPYDLIFLPGGLPNAHILRDDPRILDHVTTQVARGGYLAAICAAPLVLEKTGMIANRQATSHPSVQHELRSCHYSEERVVISHPIVTSRSPGTAMELAFALVELLYDNKKVNEINQGVLAQLP